MPFSCRTSLASILASILFFVACVGDTVSPADAGTDADATTQPPDAGEAGSDGSVPPKSGAVDTSFGTGGVVLVTAGGGFDSDYFGAINGFFGRAALAMQPDGSIVLAGTVVQAGVAYVQVVRLHADGSLDTTFGTGGKTDFTKARGAADAVVIQPGGLVVVAGTSKPSTYKRITLWRYTATGVLDSSFGSGGVAVAADPNITGDDYGRTALVRSDNDIVVGGTQAISPTAMVTGVFDGTTGAQLTTYDNELNSLQSYFFAWGGSGSSGTEGHVVGLQPGDKTVLFGLDKTSVTSAFSRANNVGSYVNVGSPPQFGVTTSGPSTHGILATAMTTTGFVTANGTTNGAGGIVLSAYTPDGVADTTFGAAGSLTVPMSTALDEPWAMATQNDGKYLVAGQNGATHAAFALRALKSGSGLDSSFAAAGLAASVFGTSNDPSVAFGAAVTASGAIMVAGVCQLTGGALGALCVTRLFP